MKLDARTGILPVLFFLLGVVPVAGAQYVVRSRLDWRTIETEHFAFHYPTELEVWTRNVAARVEAIDAAVARIVGYAPARKTHVVVDDPFQTANGMAFPFLDLPVINLWASPPTPRDDIGEYRDWGEMLTTHEFAHIAHLTRPTRNPVLGVLLNALPVKMGPIALRAPRWVIEGYATFVEGRATGSGRPHGVWRAALLRQWALEGQLPRYEALDASGAYEGGSFAYLAGSAFIEWVARTHGDSSLVDVWRRLSARQNRTFEEAFAGVYGESAATLYGRFSAEVTGKSLEVARAVAAVRADTGAIVQRLARTTGDPAISADGQRVALVVRSATLPSRVVVWRTAPEPDTLKRKRDSLLVAADSQDVPSRPIHPPPKRALATLRSKGGAPYESPRFLRDGRILLSRSASRGDGSLVWDLHLWDTQARRVRRVTHGASVRDADPLPNGRSAVATRCRGGWCDLVLVNLIDGTVTSLLDGNAERSFYRPRVSWDGASVLVGMHQSGRWRLATIDLATRTLALLDVPDAANRYDAVWLGPREIVTTSERGGIAHLERINLQTSEVHQVSRTTGADVAPEPNPADRSVWFLSLHARGYDVRRLDRAEVSAGASAAPLAIDPALAPALSPLPDGRPQFAAGGVSSPRPFDLGVRVFRWIPQPSLDADGGSAALALVSRDLIGRSEVSATIAYGEAAAWRGVSAGALWLGTAPALRVQLFSAWQKLGASRSGIIPRSLLDVKLTGAELAVDRALQYDAWAARFRLGASAAQLRALSAAAVLDGRITAGRLLAFGDAAGAWTQRGDRSSFTETLGGSVTVGRTSETLFQRGVATASVSASGRAVIPLTLSGTYGRASNDAPAFELFALGGGPSTLLDRPLVSQRLPMGALPAGISIGSSAFTYRAALATRPVSWYLWGGSTSVDGERFRSWHRVVGVEWTMSIPAVPAAGTPAARAHVGVGESLDAPFRRKVRAYVSLVLNP